MSSTSTSKTSATSSIGRELRAYSRRFAASVTAFARRYRTDVFYRTGWNVVVLQVTFALILVALTVSALAFMYEEIVRGLLTNIAEAVESGIFPDLESLSIAWSLEYEKQRAMVLAATGVLSAAAVFGYLITRIALEPTRRALEAQKQFVGNIAHEIRTPLSILKTNTEVMLFDDKLDPEARTTLRSNLEELDRISDTVNNFLSMNALLHPGRMEFGNVDIASVIERVVASFRELREHKHITVTTTLSEHRTVWGNDQAIEQIILNVIKNALVFTPNGGMVRILTEPTFEGELEITVEDSGVGIPEKDLERIFEPFYRGDRSRNRKSGGSGLGLAIVSELVKLHKGRISLRSTPGEGTTVRIMLRSGEEPRRDESKEVSMDFTGA